MSDLELSPVPAEPSRRERLGLLIKRVVFLGLPIFVLVGAFVGVGIMGMFSPAPEEKETVIEAVPVLTAQAVLEPVQLSVVSQGEVRARKSVVLAAEVGGRVSYVSDALLPGGRFKRGERLVRIDPQEFSLRVVQAEAAVAGAATALMQARSEAETAARDVRELGIENVSDLALRRPQVAEAEARLASAEAALAEAQLNLARTEIRAPFDGRVLRRNVEQGAFISTGVALGEIFASDVVEVPVPLTDKDLAILGLGIGFLETPDKLGPPVRLTALVADTPHEWTGRITRTDSGFDPETRVLFAYVDIEDPYETGSDNGVPLAVGLFATVEIEGRSLDNSVVVPRTALRGDNQVYVAKDDDTMEIRPVQVASSSRERAVLSGGLNPGEWVITSPVRGAGNGMKINPVDREELLVGDPASDGDTDSTSE